MFCEVVLRKSLWIKKTSYSSTLNTNTERGGSICQYAALWSTEGEKEWIVSSWNQIQFKLTELWRSKTERCWCVVNSKIKTEEHFPNVTSDRRRLAACRLKQGIARLQKQVIRWQSNSCQMDGNWPLTHTLLCSVVFLGQKSENRTFMFLWLANVSRVRLNIKQPIL